MARRPIFLLALLALAGCATRPLSFACPRLSEFRYPVGDRALTARAAARTTRSLTTELTRAFARAAAARTPAGNTRAILVLSGGGPWGAFGAGFLRGWSGSPTHPRPQAFDLVTGVSTGALQATDAFLGTSEDGALEHAYTIQREGDLVRRRGVVSGALTGSFAGTRPLEARLRAALAPLYDRVAAAGTNGRLLLVGTVDALDGRMYGVDLTRIARELTGTERAACYAGALMASAAVPIVFDRVEIGGRPYFDGGVRRSVFVTDIQAAAARTVQQVGASSQVYVLINGDPGVAAIDHLARGLLPTLGRLRTLAFDQIEVSSIEAVARAAPPGSETYIVTAAGNPCGPDDAGHGALFDPAFMRCLIAYGRSRWQVGDPWTRYAGGEVPKAADTSPLAAPTPVGEPGPTTGLGA